MAEGPLQRATCARCKRPACVCYCSSFPAKLLRTERTHVLVLQHKHETHRRAAISSVPVLTQTLANVRLVTVDDDCDCSPGVSDDLDECLYNGGDATIDAAFVLFPDDRAQPLESTCDKAKSIGESKRVLLIVIDGTWREAKKIARRNRQVWEQAARSWEARGASFHYVCLGNEERIDGARARRSIYGDLRREPMEGCMSTLEAVASALYVLEPREIRQILHDSLLRAFKAKVSIQERYQEQGRVAKLKQYGGISKAKAVEMKRLERQQQQLQVKVEP
uniref:tRNA-uridine aminocarboxypropyltransferase n=1 Tax=Hyaloperonospora arabidopsidis (strain Emoy2) TaxID=559515 RepID=M4B626_HYAAE